MTTYLLSIRRADDLDGPPIFMTSDCRVIGAAVEALLAQLGQRSDPHLLRLVDRLEHPNDPTPGPTP